MDYQWYPGHMTKAIRQMKEDIKLIDIVIELVDARIPNSSRNPDIDNLANNKSRLVILNKSDLADLREVTQEEIDNFTKANNNIKYFEASAKDGINIDECFNYIAEQLMNQHDSKEKEMAKSNDIIKSEKLKENTVVIIGKKKCCF